MGMRRGLYTGGGCCCVGGEEEVVSVWCWELFVVRDGTVMLCKTRERECARETQVGKNALRLGVGSLRRLVINEWHETEV